MHACAKGSLQAPCLGSFGCTTQKSRYMHVMMCEGRLHSCLHHASWNLVLRSDQPGPIVLVGMQLTHADLSVSYMYQQEGLHV